MQKQLSKCRIGMSIFTRKLLDKVRIIKIDKVGEDGTATAEDAEQNYKEWSAWEETKHESISKAKNANGRSSIAFDSTAELPNQLLQ